MKLKRKHNYKAMEVFMRKAIIAMATVILMITGAGIIVAQDRGAVEKKAL